MTTQNTITSTILDTYFTDEEQRLIDDYLPSLSSKGGFNLLEHLADLYYNIANFTSGELSPIAGSGLGVSGTALVVNVDGVGIEINSDTLRLKDGGITNAKIASGAGISFSKFETLTSGNIIVGNGSNVAGQVSVTGDISLNNAGVTAIASGSVTPAKQSTAARTRVAILPLAFPAPTGSNQGPFTKCAFTCSQAFTIVSVKIASDIPTSSSDATNNYSFLPRNNTAGVYLDASATTTVGVELSDVSLKAISISQNTSFAANDVFVIVASIADDGSAGPTNISAAQLYAVVEYTI